MMPPITVSRPFMAMLRAAGVDPSRIAAAFERRARFREEMLLRPVHPHLVAIRKASGAPVMMVRRRRGRLYADLESRSPFWTYRELAGGRAEFTCGGRLSDAVGTAMEGRRFGDVVQVASLSAFLDDERVVAVDDCHGLITVFLGIRHVRLP